MIDPQKSRAAALALFDASCQNVRKLIEEPSIGYLELDKLQLELEKLGCSARHVLKIQASIKELEELQ
jgi:hypothetical protein